MKNCQTIARSHSFEDYQFDINGISYISILYLLLIVYLNMSKAVALKVLISVVGSCLR